MGDAITVLKVDRRSHLNDDDVGNEHQPFLIHQLVLRRRGKGLAGYGVNVNYRLTLGSRNLAVNGARMRGHRNCKYQSSR